MNVRYPVKKVLIPLLLPVAGFYGNAAEACPNGISLTDCVGCHTPAASFSYSAAWSSIPLVMERNSTDTVTFSMSGSGASAGGFAAQTSLGSFTATFDAGTGTTDEVIMDGPTNRNISHSVPKGTPSWSFTFNSGNTSGTASFQARGNPVNGNRTSDVSCSDFTGTSGDGPFPTANTSVIINDAPSVNAGAGTAAYTEDGGAVTVAGSLTVTDAESDNLQSGVVTITTNYNSSDGDVLNINNTTCTNLGLICSGSGTRTITISGGPEPAADFQAVYRAITFSNTSQHPSTATRTVQFSVTDQHSRTRSDTRDVSVTRENDPPVANNDTISVDISGTATTLDGGASSVLTNDTDPDTGQAATNTASLVNPVTPVSNGTLTFNSDGTFSYTHDGSNTTSDSFTYEVSDGLATDTGTVNITISNTNPTAVADNAGVLEGGSVNIDVLNNDTDVETPGALSVVNITNETNGTAVVEGDNTVTFTHDESETTTASFQYQASDGFLTSSSTTVTITVTPVNDPPQLAAIADQTGTENIAFTFNAGTFFSDVDDNNNGTDITWDFESGRQAGMTISSLGVIDWTPPQTEVFDQVYGPIVVRASDGGEDGAAAATTSFSITVSPPDGDSDNVADYNDLCLTVADPTNADNDNDGTPGSDGGANDGGDVCDLDDDNDGMPDDFEDSNGFDKFDSADAAEDADGDGVSNFDEFKDGTNPILANITIDATGYFTPYILPPPDPADIDVTAKVVTADRKGPFRPGRNSITWTASNSTIANLGNTVQTLDVRPIVSLTPGQTVTEGSTVTVEAMLNGVAAIYPVTVNYTVSGTAGSEDHDALSGSLVFNDPDRKASFSFNVASDTLIEGNETVIITLTDVTNAVVGSRRSHTATIVEGNVLHELDLRISQGGVPVSSAYASEGTVSVDLLVTDANSGQTHQIDWSRTDNSLSPPVDLGTTSWSFTPSEGNFRIEAVVTDNEEEILTNRVSRLLKIETTAPVLTTDDSDGDTIDDITEGLGDSDDDGIPDYLDSVDGNSGDSNILPNQTSSLENQFFVETESGLSFRVGKTASAASQFGVIITAKDIENFGSENGSPPLNAIDDYDHVGGIYDFEISGLVSGSSVNVVIPLEVAIPLEADYRKFKATTGWGSFVENANNSLASAPGELGACPQPGSASYQRGLNHLDNCLQLTIEDGGPNDADGLANGVVADPGSIAVQLKEPETPSVKGGGLMHPWLIILIGFGVPLLYSLIKKKKTIG